MASANLKTITGAAGANYPDNNGYGLPFLSYLTTTFHVLVSAGTATAQVQTSLDDGTTWIDVPNTSTTSTSGVLVTYAGPLPRVRLNVAGTGNGTVHMAWGDNH